MTIKLMEEDIERNILSNILLNEGMNIIFEHLDIFNLFRYLFHERKKMDKISQQERTRDMSTECKKELSNLCN